MNAHFIRVAIRNIRRNLTFSLINIAGLAIGMAVCLTIMLYLQFELSFDRFHPDLNRTYRIITRDNTPGSSLSYIGLAHVPLGETAQHTYPEVESMCRVSKPVELVLTLESNRQIHIDQYRSVDSNFFQFFNFKLWKGSPDKVFLSPSALVISRSMAKKMFGEEEAFGKTVKSGDGRSWKIDGIADDPPANSHIQFEAMTSFVSYDTEVRKQPKEIIDKIEKANWKVLGYPTYLKMKPGASIAGFDKKMYKILNDNGVEKKFVPFLQPMKETHLFSTNIVYDYNDKKNDASLIYTLAGIAILILTIAAVNYINLSTSRASLRAKEVGLRKVVGSDRKQLIQQFLGESVFISLIALLIAISIAELLLPWINEITGYQLHLSIFKNGWLVLCMVGMVAFTGLLAGLYPAFVMSSFKPVIVLKGAFHSGSKGRILRRLLVVFQFALSIGIICSTIIVNRQIRYIQTKDLGYNREQVLKLNMTHPRFGQSMKAFKNELKASPYVVDCSNSQVVPPMNYFHLQIRNEHDSKYEAILWNQYPVDYRFISTLKMKVVLGREFDPNLPSDTTDAVMINEEGVRNLGLKDPIGKRIYADADTIPLRIIGVLQDFHTASMRQKIEPMVMFLWSQPMQFVSIRLKGGSVKTAVENVESIWKKVYPGFPFEYKFLDEEFDRLYRQDINFAKITNAFSILAIFIACLGLYGLVSHTTEQRRNEIGMRKVLGASSGQIVSILVFDYLKWIALANVIAWPIAYWVSERWLSGFEYHIVQPLAIYPLIGIGALAISVLAVYSHVLRAASANPINSLRYE